MISNILKTFTYQPIAGETFTYSFYKQQKHHKTLQIFSFKCGYSYYITFFLIILTYQQIKATFYGSNIQRGACPRSCKNLKPQHCLKIQSNTFAARQLKPIFFFHFCNAIFTNVLFSHKNSCGYVSQAWYAEK